MEEVQKIVYDPEKDVKFKERIELSKNVFFSAFGKVLFIVRWLLFIGGFISLLSFTGVLIPVVMVAWGNHHCGLYSSDRNLLSFLSPWVLHRGCHDTPGPTEWPPRNRDCGHFFHQSPRQFCNELVLC